MKSMSLIDYGFLLAESPGSPKHVAGLLIFELPQHYRGNFIRGLLTAFSTTKVGPPFNLKLRPAWLGLPSWVEDDNLDLDYHIRHSALPRPGAMEDLMKLVSRLHAQLLDRTRPLWEFHLIEGLKHRRFALYAKIHHAYVDGATAVLKLRNSLSDSPDDKIIRAIWEPTGRSARRQHSTSSSSLTEQLLMLGDLLATQAKAVPELSQTFAKMGLQTLGLRKGRLPIPFTAPRSPLNVTVTAARRVAVHTLSLSRIKTVGNTIKATVNEVFLTIVDGALHRYLREKRAAPSSPLIAQMPVSIRREDDGPDGNQIAILLVKLGSSDTDPLSRLREIRASSLEVKTEAHNLSAAAITDFTVLTQGTALLLEVLQLSQHLPPLANVLVSNVLGPQEPLYLNGAALVSCYPISTLPPGLSLNVTAHAYRDNVDFGLLADRDALPDLDRLARYLGDFFEQLESAALAETNRTDKSDRVSEP